MSMPLMKCGHVAQAIDTKTGKPCCVICLGIDKRATEVEDNLPDLTGRTAKCIYCGKKATSSNELPFFEYKDGDSDDRYYCGCMGWD